MVSTRTRRRQQTRKDRDRIQRRINRLELEALEDRCLLSTGFTQINLDSDVPGLARVTDSNLVNPWGIAFSPTGAFWFGENGTSVSDVVDGDGQILPITVSIPGANGSRGTPTGVVYNGGSGFQVAANGVSGSAQFLFATEDGTISGWNPKVDFSHALETVDNSAQGADYMGLALANGADGKSYLYAADFGRGEIDVFDSNFHQVALSGSFGDPNLPAGFAPFNVQNINGQLFVAYVKKDAAGNEDVPGAGNGLIDVFSTSGNLVERLASGGALNSPWGLAVAPQSFGTFGGALLVGNNGDGRISAYDLGSGAYLGQLTDSAGNPIVLDNLWGLTVGNDHLAGNSKTLFFAAGIDREQHGLFGAIQNSQSVQLGTAGTLPYDPSSDQDDYPLPPAQGPALDRDFGQAAPTPVLLAANNSSFSLVPTLSISSEPSQGQTAFSLVPVRSSTVPEGISESANPGVTIGAISLPAGLTAFSSTSPMISISLELPTARIRDPMDGKASDSSTTTSFMLLGSPPSTDFTEPESPFLLVSNGWSRTHPQTESQAGSGGAIYSDYTHNNIGEGGNRFRIGASLEKGNQFQMTRLWSQSAGQPSSLVEPATASAALTSPAVPFHVYLFRGLIFAAAACLPWNHFGASKKSDRNYFSLRV